jgi:hypothetical protein
MTEPLKGPELLQKIKEMPSATKQELAKACGYYSAQGNERARLNAFYAALLDAKGVNLGVSPDTTPRGKLPSFRTKVHFNGNLLVGSRYVEQLGFKPGDEFEIKLGKTGIRLVPLGHVAEPDEDLVEEPKEFVEQTQNKWEDEPVARFPSRLVS